MGIQINKHICALGTRQGKSENRERCCEVVNALNGL